MVATITTNSYPYSDIDTAIKWHNVLRDNLIISGFTGTRVDFSDSTYHHSVFTLMQNTTPFYYVLRTQDSNRRSYQYMANTFDGVSTLGDIGTTSSYINPPTNTNIYIKTINHPEIKGISLVYNVTTSFFYGITIPGNKPNWWIDDTKGYYFLPQSLNMSLFYTARNNYVNINGAYRVVSNLTGVNNVTSTPDAYTGVVLRADDNDTHIGIFSDDVIQGGFYNNKIWDIARYNTEEYLILTNNVGLAIRIL